MGSEYQDYLRRQQLGQQASAPPSSPAAGGVFGFVSDPLAQARNATLAASGPIVQANAAAQAQMQAGKRAAMQQGIDPILWAKALDLMTAGGYTGNAAIAGAVNEAQNYPGVLAGRDLSPYATSDQALAAQRADALAAYNATNRAAQAKASEMAQHVRPSYADYLSDYTLTHHDKPLPGGAQVYGYAPGQPRLPGTPNRSDIKGAPNINGDGIYALWPGVVGDYTYESGDPTYDASFYGPNARSSSAKGWNLYDAAFLLDWLMNQKRGGGPGGARR